jgi:vancomycin resistance protein YoaR
MNMRRKTILLSAFLFLALTVVFGGKVKYAAAAENDTTICKGVFIGDVDVSGMTKEEAKTAVDNYIESLRNKGIAVMVGENIVYRTMGDLGYEADPKDDIDQALDFGKSGNLIKRYKDLKDIEQGNVVLPLNFTYDVNKINELVSGDVSKFNIAPVNASVKRKNGKFVYTDEVVGSKVNITETANAIEAAIKNWNHQDLIVEAVMEDDMPLYTKDIVEQCNTVMGTFTTEYASSAEGRAANLANGARLINNTVLYPGDVFSAYQVLTPFTEENGYYVAGAYLNGVVVDSVGGGACQVTTTLYNAVLAAELEVVERQPHSMTISYVDLSRDAAIAGTYKDFKFKNNTDAPIVIEASTKSRKITFKIWGHETRDTVNRKIEYETVVLSTTKPSADVVTEDPSQPTTYRQVTQTAHTGYKAQLWKIVYENGVEVSRALVNTSNYESAPQYITIGTKEVKEDKTGKDADSAKNNGSKTDKPSQNTQNNTTDNNTTESDSINQNDQPSQDDQPITEWDPSWDLEEPVD